MQRTASHEALETAANPPAQTEPAATAQTEANASTNTAQEETKSHAAATETSVASTHKVTAEMLGSADPTKVLTDTTEKVKQFIRTNCAPALSIANTTFLVADGSYQSSNRAALGFTTLGATAYLRGDSTVALISTGFAAYFTISSTCQRGLSESVKAFVTTSTKLVTGACRIGITLFNTIKNKVSPTQPTADVKMKRP